MAIMMSLTAETKKSLKAGQDFLDTTLLKHQNIVKDPFKTCLRLFLGNMQTVFSTVCKKNLVAQQLAVM